MTDTAASSSPPADVVAKPDRLFRMKRYLIVLMLVGMGLWFCYDGFYNWPREKREADAVETSQPGSSHKPHSDNDIFLNQLLGVALVPLGLLALTWFLYGSRGEYRLSGQTLHVPGHPPITLDSITQIDKSKWERKGVATIRYQPPGGRSERQFRLDDYVYDRDPTDLILKRLEEGLLSEEQNPPAGSGAG
jgi:hypothetical protein